MYLSMEPRRVVLLLSLGLILANGDRQTKADEQRADANANLAAEGDLKDKTSADQQHPRRRRLSETRDVVELGPRTEIILENGLKKERTVYPFRKKTREDSYSPAAPVDIERATVSDKSSDDTAEASAQKNSSNGIPWFIAIAGGLVAVFWLSIRVFR